MSVAHFLPGCAAAFVLKLTTSMDDLIWFSPFLTFCKTDSAKYKCGFIYLLISMYVTVASYALAEGSEYGLDALLRYFIEDYDGLGFWNSSRILSCVASIFIGSYALKEYVEWKEDEDNDFSFFCGESKEHSRNEGEDLSSCVDNGEESDTDPEDLVKKDFSNEGTPLVRKKTVESDGSGLLSKESRRLFVVAFCGSLDDTAMFAAVLMGKGLMWSELLVGSIFASSIVFFLCMQIASYRPFADFISNLPIWTLFTFLSLYILIQGLV